jgi:hypothetical protein
MARFQPPEHLPHLPGKTIHGQRRIKMSSDKNKMKDGNDADNKRLDPESALGYRLMIYMIIAVILVAISITILKSWISK